MENKELNDQEEQEKLEKEKLEKEKLEQRLFIVSNLRDFIEASGKSQAGLGRNLGITRQGMTRWMTGENVYYDKLPQLYSLGCNLNWLFTGHEDMFANNKVGRDLDRKYHQKTKGKSENEDKERSELYDMSKDELIDYVLLIRGNIKEYKSKIKK